MATSSNEDPKHENMSRAFLWLATGFIAGAATYAFVRHSAQSSWPILAVAALPAAIAWILENYKKSLEIVKLRRENQKLIREAKKDERSDALVQRISSDISRALLYSERDQLVRKIEESQDQLKIHFDGDYPK